MKQGKQRYEIMAIFFDEDGEYEGKRVGEKKKYLELAIREAHRVVDLDRIGARVEAKVTLLGKVAHSFTYVRMGA